ncbi:MAG: tetratricopeptide repeat protein [Bryobacteraceae bacterium]|nr:tetratricopeptide repeat protein [Bryobacteraceae bacterium]
MPVHRLIHDKAGSVFAYPAELDAWWQSRQQMEARAAGWAEEKRPSVAILRFNDLSKERDQDYFCDGVAEEILGSLGKISGLRVISRVASFRLDPQSANLLESARKLRAAFVIQGSVRKANGNTKIAVQLTSAATGDQVWAESYATDLSDIFAVQEEIARSVAAALELKLTTSESAALQWAPTSQLQAYDCYLRGRKHYYGYGPSDVDCAIRLFEKATRIDPGYALAWAGLADGWSYTYLYSERTAEALARAQEAARHAVEMEPKLAQAHASLALALSLAGAEAEIENEFETALQLDPNLFEAWYFYARHAFAQGDLRKAIRLYEQAMRVRPEDYQSPLLVAQSYEETGSPERARAVRLLGVKLAAEHLEYYPGDVRALYMGANGLVSLGRVQEGLEWAARARRMRPNDSMLLYNLGCVYALAGKSTDALDCLELAVDSGLTQRGWFLHDSNLDTLRGSPRFEAILSRLP